MESNSRESVLNGAICWGISPREELDMIYILHHGITGESKYGFLRDWEESEEEDNDHRMRIVSEPITTNNIKTREGNLKRQEVFRRWTCELAKTELEMYKTD